MKKTLERLEKIISELKLLKDNEEKNAEKSANYEIINERLKRAEKLKSEIENFDENNFDVNLYEFELDEFEKPIY